LQNRNGKRIWQLAELCAGAKALSCLPDLFGCHSELPVKATPPAPRGRLTAEPWDLVVEEPR